MNDLKLSYDRFYDAVRNVQDAKIRRTEKEYKEYPYSALQEGKVKGLRKGLERARSQAVSRKLEIERKAKEAEKFRGQRRD